MSLESSHSPMNFCSVSFICQRDECWFYTFVAYLFGTVLLLESVSTFFGFSYSCSWKFPVLSCIQKDTQLSILIETSWMHQKLTKYGRQAFICCFSFQLIQKRRKKPRKTWFFQCRRDQAVDGHKVYCVICECNLFAMFFHYILAG